MPRRISAPGAWSAGVAIGGGAPVVVQSMTNTDTADAAATARRSSTLARAGSELVRITVNTPEAARRCRDPRRSSTRWAATCRWSATSTSTATSCSTQYPDCARALAKYRINPGNVGKGAKRDDQFATMIETALEHGKPVRIGVNWGSLDPELLARMMDENARLRRSRWTPTT